MRTKKLDNGWSRRDLRLAAAVSEVASITDVKATIELHSPAHKCRKCGQLRTVNILPELVCAGCWSLPVIAAASDNLARIDKVVRGFQRVLSLAN